MPAAAPLVDLTPLLVPVFLAAFVALAIAGAMRTLRRRGDPQKRSQRRTYPMAPVVRFPAEAVSWQDTSGDSDGVDHTANWTAARLQTLEWKRLEHLTALFFEALGFTTRTSRVGADGGVDVTLYRKGEDTPVGLAQCKAWVTYRVGVKPVRELFGVMAAERIQHGVFVTASEFTEEAREFAQGKDLELVDGTTLISFIRKLPLESQQHLSETVFSGDYTTPTCPNCGVKMVLRSARKGPFAGSDFWGCPDYPRCRRTFNLRRNQSQDY